MVENMPFLFSPYPLCISPTGGKLFFKNFFNITNFPLPLGEGLRVRGKIHKIPPPLYFPQRGKIFFRNFLTL